MSCCCQCVSDIVLLIWLSDFKLINVFAKINSNNDCQNKIGALCCCHGTLTRHQTFFYVDCFALRGIVRWFIMRYCIHIVHCMVHLTMKEKKGVSEERMIEGHSAAPQRKLSQNTKCSIRLTSAATWRTTHAPSPPSLSTIASKFEKWFETKCMIGC